MNLKVDRPRSLVTVQERSPPTMVVLHKYTLVGDGHKNGSFGTHGDDKALAHTKLAHDKSIKFYHGRLAGAGHPPQEVREHLKDHGAILTHPPRHWEGREVTA